MRTTLTTTGITNTIACWTLDYTREALELVKKTDAKSFDALVNRIGFKNEEAVKWKTISEKMYYPEDAGRGVFLQAGRVS